MLILYSQMPSNPFLTGKTQETQKPKLELSSPSTSALGVVPGADVRGGIATRLVPHRWLGWGSKALLLCSGWGSVNTHGLMCGMCHHPHPQSRPEDSHLGGGVQWPRKRTEAPLHQGQGRVPVSREGPRADGTVNRGAGQVHERGELARPSPRPG